MSYPLSSQQTVQIAANASLSNAIQLSGRAVAGIFIPSTWTTANLTFQASPDGVSWSEVYDVGNNETTYQVTAGAFCSGSPSDFVGLNWLKIRSGTLAAPVNQALLAALIVMLRQIPNLR